MPRQRRDDAQFGIGQGVEAIQPDGAAVQAFGVDARRGQFQTPGAQGQAAALQFPVHFPVDRQKGVVPAAHPADARQAGAVASRR